LRAALGAGRGRLVRQLLTETVVLFLLAGVAGVGLAVVLVRIAGVLLPLLPAALTMALTVDWRVIAFAASLSIAAAALFGIVPALRGSSADARAALDDGARSTSGRSRLRSAFVAAQIAGSVLMVVLGLTFVRVLRHAGGDTPGFDARAIDLATIDLSVSSPPDGSALRFWPSLLERVRQTPTVEAASLARVPPGGWEGIGLGSVAPADQAEPAHGVSPAWNIVERGYFATLAIPVTAGRDFAASDTAGAAPVAIVSEAIAHRFWPGQSAVGRTLRLAMVGAEGRPQRRVATVIGVVGDIRSSSLIDGLAEPYVYLPLAQSDGLGMLNQMSIVARRRSGAPSLVPVMSGVVQQLDRRLVLARGESLADAISLGLTPQRVLAAIGGVMGLVTLLLASMGIYGVTAYTVALRRREFAIRLALGAPRARVVRMVLWQSVGLVAAGLGVGLVLAMGVGRALAVFFYGLHGAHLPTLLATTALFTIIGAAAAFVPARQAVREGWRGALQED
jgi:predicted permease